MVPKRKFEFESMEGLVDIYLDGKKVREKHPGSYGHIYFRISPDEKYEADVAPHDSRIGMEAEIKDGRVVPLKIERAFQKKPKTMGVDVTKDTVVMGEIEKAHTLQHDKHPLFVDKAVKRGENPKRFTGVIQQAPSDVAIPKE